MVNDLLEATGEILRILYDEPIIKKLRPIFTLAGSITEGTRFGYGNELDLGMKFLALEEEEEVHVAPAAAAATAQHHVVAGGGHGQVNRMAEWSECPPCTGKVGGSNPGSRKLKTFN